MNPGNLYLRQGIRKTFSLVESALKNLEKKNADQYK